MNNKEFYSVSDLLYRLPQYGVCFVDLFFEMNSSPFFNSSVMDGTYCEKRTTRCGKNGLAKTSASPEGPII